MLQPPLFVVPDATQDESLAGHPLVTGDTHVRFFAGAALLTESGQALGTLAIMDRVPRQLSRSQRDSLKVLGRQVMSQLELHRRTRELVESEARLFQVLRSCPVPLTIHRLSDRTFVEVNPEFSRLIGWTREEVIGRTRRGTAHRGTKTQTAQLWYRLETLGKLQDTETVVRTRTGESRRILLSTALVELSSGPHAITTFVDITGREQAEKRCAKKMHSWKPPWRWPGWGFGSGISATDRGGSHPGQWPGVRTSGGRVSENRARSYGSGASRRPRFAGPKAGARPDHRRLRSGIPNGPP